MKILSNNMYLLLIDEEAEIREGNYYFANQGVMLCSKVNEGSKYPYLNQYGNYDSIHWKGIIIAYYPLTKEAKEFNLPLLPKPFKTYRVGRKQKRAILDEKGVEVGIFKTGSEEQAQKYCDYLNNKQFSLEDMKKAYTLGTNYANVGYPLNKDVKAKFEQLIFTQQLPKEFVPEYRYYYQSSKEFYSDAGFVECSKEQYRLIKEEIPTCPVKVELKTITNSEGKEEIVGTYKYNTKKS